MLAAIQQELAMQRHYLQGASLASIYLGGGTPSLLSTAELVQLFETIQALYPVLPDAEITLEANPDDLSREKLSDLRAYTPVNRLSIGIQSFNDADLQWMHRAHNAQHAHDCLRYAAALGFEDLTIDLIYGSPTTSDAQWAENLRLMLDYHIPHLSCYCLTVEEGTALHHFVKKGKSLPVDEDKAIRQFEYLMEVSEKNGYDHYEISNFAKPGHYARHNSNYWRGVPYLGIGPSAHAFDGLHRQWNIANNTKYIQAIQNGIVPFERETLTPAQRYNEYIMTALRTIWGVEPEKIKQIGQPFFDRFFADIQSYQNNGMVEVHQGAFRLTKAGKLLADRIAMELFLTAD